MFKIILFFLSYLVSLSLYNYSIIAQSKSDVNQSIDYREALDYLYNLKSNGEVADVTSEIVLERDVATFKLLEGKLYLLSSYDNINYALIFIGDGEFSFTPPSEIERKQLFRFFDTEHYRMEFQELFLLFDDNTYDTLLFSLELKKTKPSLIQENIKNFLSIFKEGYDETRTDFIRSMLLEGRNGFFHAQIQENKFEPVFFQIDPYESEEVSFMKGKYIVAKKYREVINLFPAKHETLTNYSRIKPNKYFLDLNSYNIESTIKDNLDFVARCSINFKAIEDNQDWIVFYLYQELQVDSVKWENNTNAQFVKEEESSEFWIKFDSKFLDDKQHSITIYYHGDLLENSYAGWLELKSSASWYPRFYNHEKARFRLIFHTPLDYELVSVGEPVTEFVENEEKTTEWLCETPARNVSFYIGKFEKYKLKKENLPEVDVFTSDYTHQNNVDADYIAQDISSSIQLFSELFGPPPIDFINVSEIPYSHSEAFPGLVHLSWITANQLSTGMSEIVRAHETAHQWWGIGVDFDTYHDQWLSEGFATYSGLWYLQAAKNDNQLFFDILNDWKDEILNVREYLFGSGQEAGPVWLGYRTSSTNTWGDYNLIVYKKGAWILHMLRAMLLELNTMNEDQIKKLMQDFYSTYKNKNASTADFKKIVDKHFGEDMSWFFNQYVYGTDIPLYKVAKKTKKTDDGKLELTIRIRQEGVPEKFKMYVPVKLILDGNRLGRFRIEVKDKETIITLPPIDGELDELVFNDLESVLCEVEYEGW